MNDLVLTINVKQWVSEKSSQNDILNYLGNIKVKNSRIKGSIDDSRSHIRRKKR